MLIEDEDPGEEQVRAPRGTYFKNNSFIGKTIKTIMKINREAPPGYSPDDYDLRHIVATTQSPTTDEELSVLYHAEYVHDATKITCSLLRVFSDGLPPGMDVSSLLGTMYNSSFKSFLPSFGCDFMDEQDGSVLIVLEPCFPQYTSREDFMEEFQSLDHVDPSIKLRILARVFAKLFQFVDAIHSEDCAGWFDLTQFFVAPGHEALKFFSLGFSHFESGESSRRKKQHDFQVVLQILEEFVGEDEDLWYINDTEGGEVINAPSLASLRTFLRHLAGVFEESPDFNTTPAKHPFIIRYESENRLQLLRSLVATCSDKVKGNLMNPAVVMDLIAEEEAT